MDVTIFVMPVAQHVSSYILSFYSCDNLPHILNFCNYQIVQILYFSFLICTSLIPKVPEHFSRTHWLVVVPALRIARCLLSGGLAFSSVTLGVLHAVRRTLC